nr:hypothetical protein Iba_chr11eCG12120 [Ipomoea batatas]
MVLYVSNGLTDISCICSLEILPGSLVAVLQISSFTPCVSTASAKKSYVSRNFLLGGKTQTTRSCKCLLCSIELGLFWIMPAETYATSVLNPDIILDPCANTASAGISDGKNFLLELKQ